MKYLLILFTLSSVSYAQDESDGNEYDKDHPYEICKSYVRGYFIWLAVAKCEEQGKGVGPGGCFHTVSSGKSPDEHYTKIDIKHCDIFKEKS